MSSSEYWDDRYRTIGTTAVSWFQPVPAKSLEFVLEAAAGNPTAAVIDVGGGASSLVDELISRGFPDLTVLDLSGAALSVAQERLGEAGSRVEWINADVRDWQPARSYDIWHDRAVYHFLTEPADQQNYWNTVRSHLRPGGFLVMATFAEDGPTACSGLDVQRYSVSELLSAMGSGFELAKSEREVHTTPSGGTQAFNWVVARRTTD